MSKVPIRVLLVDDHELIRAGVRMLLDRMTDVQVVAEAEDGNEAMALVRTMPPDIVLVDISLPGMSGLEVSQRVASEFPETKVIILSMHESDDYVGKALHAGAKGYLVKGIGSRELEIALRSVMAGGTYLTPSVAGTIVNAFVKGTGEHSILQKITPRQLEILKLIGEGNGTKEIAHQLNISAKTVDAHRAELMERLGISEIAGLVRLAIQEGLVHP